MSRHSIFYCPTETPRRFLTAILREKFGRELKTARRLYDAVESLTGDELTVIGPAIGVPASALITEWILRHHPDKPDVVLVGTCGCYPQTLPAAQPGELVFPKTGSISPLQQRLERQCSKLFQSLNRPVYRTAVFTSLKPATEPAQTYGAVEMELAPLASAASSGQFELGAAFVISDIVGGGKAFGSPAVRSGLEALCEAAALIICGGMDEDTE